MADTEGGKMAALMKFDRTQLEMAIANTPDVVLANDNSAEQVVISGTPEAVDSILAQVKAKRAVPLNVSGAFHSPLMKEASQQFEVVLDSVTFHNAQVAILSNVEPTASTNAKELKQRLIDQMTGSVRWREIMLQLPEQKIERAIEVGPGKVLTGLIKRTCRGIELHNISGQADLEQLPQLENVN